MTDGMTPSPVTGHLIVFGDCWPVVSAVRHVAGTVLPGYRCETVREPQILIQQLARTPQAALILCLRPREHLFLLHTLTKELSCHPALVISDNLFFSDRLALRIWGQLTVMTHQALLPVILYQQLCELTPATPRCPEQGKLTDFLLHPLLPAGKDDMPPQFHLEERLTDYLSLLMYRAMLERGLTAFRMRLLQAMWSGCQNLNDLAGYMGADKRKIWNEKYRLQTQLDLKGHLPELLYGTRFCPFLQRTPFIPPAEAERWRQEAGTLSHPPRVRTGGDVRSIPGFTPPAGYYTG